MNATLVPLVECVAQVPTVCTASAAVVVHIEVAPAVVIAVHSTPNDIQSHLHDPETCCHFVVRTCGPTVLSRGSCQRPLAELPVLLPPQTRAAASFTTPKDLCVADSNAILRGVSAELETWDPWGSVPCRPPTRCISPQSLAVSAVPVRWLRRVVSHDVN